jgi:class 3 adenylate cyclase
MSQEHQGEAVLKALLFSDLVRSTHLVEEVGDRSTARLFARHDVLARELLVQHNGLEIDKADGFLLLFEHPLDAVSYALAYHELLNELTQETGTELATRVGIHFGEVFLRRNSPEHVARGAKPIEVEGLAKPITARVMSLAGPRQTLLTRGVFEIGRRAAVDRTLLADKVCWMDHGAYRLQGLRLPVRIFEVGVEGFAPLIAPEDCTKVVQAAGEPTTPNARERQRTPEELPVLITQVVQAIETSRQRAHWARRNGTRLAAVLLFVVGMAFQEYRVTVFQERLEESAERAERAERQEERITRILERLSAEALTKASASREAADAAAKVSR